MVKELTTNTFKDEAMEGLVLIDFYATWCGPCRMLGPILEEISNELDNVKIVSVDVDENDELAASYGVSSILPTK